MGALCGKKAVKKTIDALVPPQISQLKPMVFNPNLDNPSANKDNSQKIKHENSSQKPSEKSEKPLKKANKPSQNENTAQFELNMSPSKSPQKTEKSKPNIIQESQELTPQVFEDPKSKPNDSIPRQNEDFIFFEPERRLVLENNEFIGKALFGEEDFLLPEIKEPSIRELSEKNIEKIGLIGWKKRLLEPKEIVDNCFEIDLFDVLQTFEPEEDEDSRGKSDIHELNSSGIQYKEEEYGIAMGNANFNNVVPQIIQRNSNENEIIQIKEEINVEDKYDESKDRNTLAEEKPLERPESFPVENVRFPPNEKITQVYKEDPNDFKWSSIENKNYNPYNPYKNNEEFNDNKEEFKEEFNNKEEEFNDKEEEFNNKEEESDNKEDEYNKEEETPRENQKFQINNVMNFLEEDNYETPFEANENIGDLAYKESNIDMERIDEQFFLNKVDMTNFEEENKEESSIGNKNEDDYMIYIKQQQQEALEQIDQRNDFSYDEITPNKMKDRISYKPNTDSLRKKLVWWSSKK